MTQWNKVPPLLQSHLHPLHYSESKCLSLRLHNFLGNRDRPISPLTVYFLKWHHLTIAGSWRSWNSLLIDGRRKVTAVPQLLSLTGYILRNIQNYGAFPICISLAFPSLSATWYLLPDLSLWLFCAIHYQRARIVRIDQRLWGEIDCDTRKWMKSSGTSWSF